MRMYQLHFFYQAFEFQKRFLKTKHPLLSSKPRTLLVVGTVRAGSDLAVGTGTN